MNCKFMKLKSKNSIQPLAAASLWTLLLIGTPILAQEKTDEGTNTTDASISSTITNVETNADEIVTTEILNDGTRTKRTVRVRNGIRHDAMVVIGSDATLKEGESTEAFVVIGGNGVVKGKVKDAAVVIGGSLEVSGEVGDAAVAVMGDLTVRSNAVINGDAVSVGGHPEVEDGATIKGTVQAVDFGALGLPRVEWLRDWLRYCVLKLRPLSLKVGWVWAIAGIYLLIYLAVAVLLRRPVEVCINEFTRRPVTTFFMGLLTKLLAPIVMIILCITVVGMIVVPFIGAALLFGAIIGKVALLEYLGDSIRRAVGSAEPLKPAVALLVGAAVITLFYLVPVLGLITLAITSLWGLGIATTAAFGSMKRETPVKLTPPPATPAAPAQPGYTATSPVAPAAAAPQNFAANVPPAAGEPMTPGSTPPTATPVAPMIPEALAYPRAGFWERMGAAFLDVIIIGILSGLLGQAFHLKPPISFLVALAYFAGMWTWKGTTVGGVVLGLKVVRLDGGPLSFLVALVRGLGAALSVIVMFLGFLWIAWDSEKQGWHDRIAGTVVVRLPRGSSLVVL
jgi:uncharacterized RDD family membrane protein YckC